MSRSLRSQTTIPGVRMDHVYDIASFAPTRKFHLPNSHRDILKAGMVATERRKGGSNLKKKSPDSVASDRDDNTASNDTSFNDNDADVAELVPASEKKKRGRPKTVASDETTTSPNSKASNKRRKTSETKSTKKAPAAVNEDLEDKEEEEEVGERDEDEPKDVPSHTESAADPMDIVVPDAKPVPAAVTTTTKERVQQPAAQPIPMPLLARNATAPSTPPLSAPSSPWRTGHPVPPSPSKVLHSTGSLHEIEYDPRPLPKKYSDLAEIFKSLDTTCCFLYRSKRQCTLDAIKSAIEQSARRTLEKRHIALIKSVWPESYSLTYQKIVNVRGRAEPQLMVEPKLQGTTNLDQAKELLERRAEFHRRLIDLVVQQHGQFLKGQVNGAPPPTGAEYTIHWHPKFPLESVADIKPAELPEPPTAQQQQSFLSSLKKNDELGSYQAILDKQIKKPFVPLARSAQTDATSSAVNKEYDPEEEILEQVRKREATQREMASPAFLERERRKWLLSNLPSYCDCLSSYYGRASKSAMLRADVIAHLTYNMGSSNIRPDQVAEKLEALLTEAPEWISQFTVDSQQYIRVSNDLKLVVDVKIKLLHLYKDLLR